METALKEISYYKTGGTVDQLYAPGSVKELADVMREIHNRKLPYFLLGAGSNSLIMDEHWPGAVVIFSNLNSITVHGTKVIAEAGVDNTIFAENCLEMSLGGASWMYNLPGQLGSTIRMNARCYGGEISRIVQSVTAVSENGKIRQYRADEVFIGYKNTVFMSNKEVVALAEFSLFHDEQVDILELMEHCKVDREKKQQFLYPSCGCVFKNNYSVGVPSGLLLDKADVRELSSDYVEISPYHANFVFNKGASAREILETTLKMRDIVYKLFGVWLEYEMEILGIIPDDLKSKVAESRLSKPKEQKLKALREEFHES
ncbi:UDP-N-acetylmuramate dehydrogenase [bacterium]|nr:UDP-N-acetylmuramate dehydrogenase [bacterium]